MKIDDLRNTIICGDCLEVLKTLPGESVNCCVTSPPYWGLRDYGVEGQLGLEKTHEEFVGKMVSLFREVRRVLRVDGTLWLNLGDSYIAGKTGNSISGFNFDGGHKTQEAAGLRPDIKPSDSLKPKDLVGIPWRVAFALQSDGWYLRQDIIWHKPNPMPESVTDRCTKAHEYIFLMTKSARYFYDAEAVKEDSVDEESYSGRRFRGRVAIYESGAIPGAAGKTIRSGGNEIPCKTYEKRNRRSVWTVSVASFSEAHFATFPPKLIEPCVRAGCPEGGIVLDPFMGAGTTGLVATKWGRNYIGIELNPEYKAMAEKRIQEEKDKMGLFNR